MANLNATTMADAVKTKYESRLLTRALPRLIHGRWGKMASINKYGAQEIRKYGSLSAVSSSLTEGATPAENAAPSLTLITLTPQMYGSWIGYSDYLEMVDFDPFISEVSSILGEQCGLSADTLLRNAMTDGATVDYSGNATSRATLDAPVHNMTYADFLKQYAALQAADAMPIDGQDFVVIMHPWVYATLLSDPVFVNAFIQETSNSPLRSGYMGRWLNCRVFVTSNARTVADSGVDSSTTVYMCLFFGKEAYGYCGLGNITPDLMDGGGDGFANNTGKSVKPVQLIVNQLGSAGTADPLNQRATIGWKMSLASTVLNANWIRSLECTSIASDD